MSLFPFPLQTPDYRRADRMRGLIIVGATFVLCLLVSVWAKRRALPEVGAPPAPVTPVGVVGFPNHVDAVKTLAQARTLTRRALLRSIQADWVTNDGLVDVSARGRVRYEFQSAAGQGPQPPREPGTLARRPYCGKQSVTVNKSGIVAESDDASAACSPRPADPLPEPRCTPADVWAYAVAHSMGSARAAHIEYYRSSAGPAWRFEGAGGHERFTLYGDCKRELTPTEALNITP
jgi:hypothetical protein